jgi:hypothetical protein
MTSSSTIDYTSEFNSLVTNTANEVANLANVNSSIEGLPNYSNELATIASSLSSIATSLTTLVTLHSSLNANVQSVTTALLDNTVGVSIKNVDIPYQGVYQRGLLRLGLTTSASLDELKRAVGEEKVSSIFNA